MDASDKKRIQELIKIEDELRRRLYSNNPKRWINDNCWIRLEGGGKGKFILRDYQEEFIDLVMSNSKICVLKARQMGFSWVNAALALWFAMYNEESDIVIMSKKEADAIKQLKRIKFIYKNLPREHKLKVINDNAGEFAFTNGSTIVSLTAGEDSGRGDTALFALWDEAAFTKFSDEIRTALEPAAERGKFVVQSTPKGIGGTFHEIYGDESFTKFICDWRKHPSRTLEWAKNNGYESEDIHKRRRFNQEYNCLHPETEIRTINGLKPIKDVKEGELVLTHKGRFKKVLKVMKRQQNNESYKITIGSKKSTNIITGNHPILRSDNTFESINDNKNTNFVLLPNIHIQNKISSIDIKNNCNLSILSEINNSTIKFKNSCKYINRNIPLDYNTGWLLGIYLAEGNVIRNRLKKLNNLEPTGYNKPKYKLSNITFEDIDKCYKENAGTIKILGLKLNCDLSVIYSRLKEKGYRNFREYQESINEFDSVVYSGINIALNKSENHFKTNLQHICNKYFSSDIDVTKIDNTNNNSSKILIYNKAIPLFLSNFLDLDNHAPKKVLKPLIYKTNKEFISGLLHGYTEGDGFSDNKRTIISTTSKQLAYQIQQLYAVFNEYYTVNRSKEECVKDVVIKNKPRYCSGEYTVAKSVIKNNNYKFFETSNIGSYIKKVNSSIFKVEKDDYNGEVYNIEVEEDNSYCTNLIVVHNCSFTGSSENVFDCDVLEDMIKKATNPISNVNGLKIYENPIPEEKYGIGADTASGIIKGDFSVAIVMKRSTNEVVAVYHKRAPFEEFAKILRDLSKKYNNALLGVEANNHGHAVLEYLKKFGCNLYRQKTYDNYTRKWTSKIGWNTNNKTKPIIIHQLEDKIRNYEITIPDKDVLIELTKFVYIESGNNEKMEASKGYHDDYVISLAICQEVLKEIFIFENKEKMHTDKVAEYLRKKYSYKNETIFKKTSYY